MKYLPNRAKLRLIPVPNSNVYKLYDIPIGNLPIIYHKAVARIWGGEVLILNVEWSDGYIRSTVVFRI